MSKNIIKLIDEAIVPAFCLIVAKMVGLLAASYFLHLPFTISNRAVLGLLPSVHFTNIQNYTIAENYSNLAMFLAAAAGTILVLVKAHFFHKSHIHPFVHNRLIKLNLENWVTPSYHLYHQAAIWLTFLWLTVGFLTISSFLKITYVPITIIAFVVAANFSWVLALDVEREAEITSQ